MPAERSNEIPFDSVAAIAARARLHALPFTVLTRITSFLTVKEALSLICTCKSLVSPAETQIYYSLNLLLYPLDLGHHVDPALARSGHRATANLTAKAQALGDPVVNPNSKMEVDLLQGALRLFARLFNADPERRRWVEAVYIDCSHIDDKRTEEVGRTFRSIGALRAVKKLTVVVSHKWKKHLEMIMTCTPNIERLNLVVSVTTQRRLRGAARAPSNGNRDESLTISPNTASSSIPPLKHLAIEGMESCFAKLVLTQIGPTKPLESLALMDWSGRWQPVDVDRSSTSSRSEQSKADGEVIDALNRSRGVRTMILPKVWFDKLKAKQLRRTLVLGLQGEYMPSMRVTDLAIPPLPRMRRLFFFTNRSSTSLPRHSLDTTPLLEHELPAALIPHTLVLAIDAAPLLTEIHYIDLINPTFSGRAKIRSFVGPNGTFMHVRVFSAQILIDNHWAAGQSDDAFGVWQDWTSYQSRVVPVDTLLQIYGSRTPTSPPARRRSLPAPTWEVLDRCIISSHE